MKKSILIPLSLSIGSGCFNFNSLKQKQENNSYHQIYVLGDSLSDTGGLVGVIQTFFTKNHYYFGEKVHFSDPSYNHTNFCNGKVAVQVLADKLKLSLKSGWDFNAFDNLEHFSKIGNSYAVGGSEYSHDTTSLGYLLYNRFTYSDQVNALLKQHKIQNNDLIVLEGGNNDLLAAVRATTLKEQQRIVNEALNNEISLIKKLISNNANHLLVTNVPNFSNVPEFVKSNQKEKTRITNIIENYDQRLQNLINNLPTNSRSKVREYSLFSAFEKYLKVAKSQGINTTDATVSIDYASGLNPFKRTMEVNYYPGKNYQSFKKDFFYDEVHPSAWTDNLIGNDFFNLVKNWSNINIK